MEHIINFFSQLQIIKEVKGMRKKWKCLLEAKPVYLLSEPEA